MRTLAFILLLALTACDPTASDIDDILNEPPVDPGAFICTTTNSGVTCSPRPQS